MGQYNFWIRDYMYKFKQDEGRGRHFRDTVLFLLVMHANKFDRCVLTIETMSKKLDLSDKTIRAILKWLFDHKAIVNVPPEHRDPGFEKSVDDSVYVFQLTGVIEFDGQIYRYLHMTPESYEQTVHILQGIGADEIAQRVLYAIENDAETSGKLSYKKAEDDTSDSVLDKMSTPPIDKMSTPPLDKMSTPPLDKMSTLNISSLNAVEEIKTTVPLAATSGDVSSSGTAAGGASRRINHPALRASLPVNTGLSEGNSQLNESYDVAHALVVEVADLLGRALSKSQTDRLTRNYVTYKNDEGTPVTISKSLAWHWDNEEGFRDFAQERISMWRSTASDHKPINAKSISNLIGHLMNFEKTVGEGERGWPGFYQWRKEKYLPQQKTSKIPEGAVMVDAGGFYGRDNVPDGIDPSWTVWVNPDTKEFYGVVND